MTMKNLLFGALFLLVSVPSLAESKYKTENVIILIMDGPRWTETWGDPSHQYIPRMANDMAQHGVIYTQFRNNGPTYTCSGHTSLTTGIYQRVENSGKELPRHPSIFQYFLKQSGKAKKSAYVISSKDKLAVLTNCKKRHWKGKHRPSSDCGNDGLMSGYRSDKETLENSLEILKNDKPNLALINFRLPDSWGHAGNWEKYLQGIKTNDEYIYQIFEFLRTDAHYQGKTTVFVTNDHGRHLDGRKDGFISHGCNCEGCRRINCFAYGPDFKEGIITDVSRELIDITATTCELMGITMEKTKGKVMRELFIDCKADEGK
ncbi:sulfatase-like hydrolase/transferase [Crocinitomix algicola]|uniref:sulfatase-like hydrolase/transferase n=1 Tax=Crocinitomix algicola TaxID=1740263 RepID=UPI0009F43C1A|nr:sulfatase-like hydrolase/transferase [Crocinitomix algicola]